MAYYRLYFMNRRGHIARFEEFVAADDAGAIAHADASGRQPKELWCSSRKVGQWSAPTVRDEPELEDLGNVGLKR